MNIISIAAPPRLHIIGLGVAASAQLSASAISALQTADIVLGSQRQLATIAALLMDSSRSECINLPPLRDLKILLDEKRSSRIVVLASGDPLFYGIGRWLATNFRAEELQFYPAVSSVQAVCHALGLALQDLDVLSLHGRPVEKLRTRLGSGRRLLILTDKNSHPQRLAMECQTAGYAQSQLHVCERMGYPQQRIRQFSATELLAPDATTFDALHITVIDVQGRGGVYPQFPGIADTAFETGDTPGVGMISKREVRLMILSLLQVADGDVVWDIGAGCGGVSVELAYWHASAAIYSIECHAQRLRYLDINRQKFGVLSNMTIVAGRAPAALRALPLPAKVFIGGSDGAMSALLSHVWALLPEGGTLVASAVTAKTLQHLQDFSAVAGSQHTEIVELAVRRGAVTISSTASKPPAVSMQAKHPVTLFKFSKRECA